MAKKVLIADDSQTIRQAFEMTFSGRGGVEIFGAGDSGTAISVAKEQMPDLIIADSQIGSTTGYDLCKQIKADGQIQSIPVWIMTGPAERVDDDLYADCGAEGHIRKPFDTQRLIEKVSSMSAPPDEEKSRPSYPPAAAKAAVPAAAATAAKPPAPAAAASEGRMRKATLLGGPVAPPVKPKPAEAPPASPKPPPSPPRAEPEVVQTKTVAELAQMGPDLKAEKPAPAPDAVEVTAGAALEGLTDEQREAVMTLIRDVVEKTIWEIVPDMAETVIREEIARLLKD